MRFELIDIAVQDKQAHPRLAGRTTGHVRAVLQEDLGDRQQTHELVIAAWADVAADASDNDIDMALMLKAAAIVARLKGNLSEES